MRAIAERTVRTRPTTAQRDCGFPRQVPLAPVSIRQHNRPFHPQRSVRANSNLHSIRHLTPALRRSDTSKPSIAAMLGLAPLPEKPKQSNSHAHCRRGQLNPLRVRPLHQLLVLHRRRSGLPSEQRGHGAPGLCFHQLRLNPRNLNIRSHSAAIPSAKLHSLAYTPTRSGGRPHSRQRFSTNARCRAGTADGSQSIE
jgi:hypothetical protein